MNDLIETQLLEELQQHEKSALNQRLITLTLRKAPNKTEAIKKMIAYLKTNNNKSRESIMKYAYTVAGQELKNSTDYYLAIDRGEATQDGRYYLIDLTKLVGKDSFKRIKPITDFTKEYANYSELFLKLYNEGLVPANLVGNPFTIFVKSKKPKHLGTNKFIRENKIFFKDDAYLLNTPSEAKLKEAYRTLEAQKFSSIDDKMTVDFNLTKVLLDQELSIPKYFDLTKASKEDQERFKFIEEFVKEIKVIINAKKKISDYSHTDNYNGYVNYLESYNNDLINYLDLAKTYHDVQPRFFVQPIKKLVHMLCIRTNKKGETLSVDNTMLYHLATFYKNYFENVNNSFKKELATLKYELERLEKKKQGLPEEPQYVQIDFWGNEISLDAFDNKGRIKKRR